MRYGAVRHLLFATQGDIYFDLHIIDYNFCNCYHSNCDDQNDIICHVIIPPYIDNELGFIDSLLLVHLAWKGLLIETYTLLYHILSFLLSICIKTIFYGAVARPFYKRKERKQ